MRADPAAVLAVDLDAVAANWRLLRDRHPSGAVAGVVKADAYGLGAAQVVPRLHREGCRHFFTAHPEEALAIRPLAPGALVGVLNGLLPGAAAEYAAARIDPVLGSLAEIAAWRAEARRLGSALPALLHVDTGMNRLGLSAAELDALAADPALLDGVAVRFVMTHLAAAEAPADPLNALQRDRFARACARLPAAPRSLANSSGIFLGPDFASDLARPGAALYGINPTPDQPNPMRPTIRLRARVLQVRAIPAGEPVGYNATWAAPRPSRIATVAVGYADGFLRALSNRATAVPAPSPTAGAGDDGPAASGAGPGAGFDGAPVPLVGRVSMDLTTFDVTDHPAIGPGAWLELIGPAMPPDAIAARAGTNGYEILTALGRRYRRAYHGA